MGEFDFDFHFEDRGSDVLVVSFHGAVNRASVGGPLFAWKRTLESRPESFLCLADPTLSLSSKLTLGWYVGTSDLNLHKQIGEWVTEQADAVGATRAVFVGSSGGGFAAMAVSAYVPRSVAVAFSPTTAINRVTPKHTSNFMEAAFPELDSFERLRDLHPERVSLDCLYASERPNRFIHVQNSGDLGRLEGSYLPFASRHGVRMEGESHHGRRRFVLEHHGDGHIAPPVASLHHWLDVACQ